MRKKSFTVLCSLLVCLVVLFCSVLPVGAIDDKYTIDELGLSIKLPKEYTVITRTTQADDEAFKKLKLDYNETMTAFAAANIYLQGVSDDEILKITLSQTSDKNSQAINNYSDLSSAERKTVLDAFLSDQMYTSGNEVKHNGNIYFDLNFAQKTRSGTIYGYQCHTVVNGMNINLTTQKSNEELTADEIKVAVNVANSINFHKIKRSSGLAFDWWRILLWILVLVACALIAHYLYKFYTKAKKQKAQERRSRKRQVERPIMSEEDSLIEAQEQKSYSRSQALFDDLGIDDDDFMTLDEILGYDTEDYHSRSNSDMDTFNIDVKSKDSSHGVSFFEDEGENIDNKPDYFEDFFAKEEESRPVTTRAASSVLLNVKTFLRHLKYFCKNLYSSFVKKFKNIGKRR